MPEFKEKVDLSAITHSVRAAQAVMQYGVGAMVDFPDQTLVTSAPEYWKTTKRIYDNRFAKALGVDFFALPINISYERFPEWYFCPKCRKFQPLKQWIAEYRRKSKQSTVEKDNNMVFHLQCPDCRQDLVVSRIVTICEKGHLNDFPWVKWVHARSHKNICGNPSLKFKTGSSANEGVAGLIIECSCGATATLRDAFDKDIFRKMDNDGENSNFLCEGHHPFKHTKEPCSCYPRASQRGSSSVYFPVVYSSLVIPPYANKLNTQIEQSQAYETCIAVIEDGEPEDREALIKKRLPKWAEKIATEIGAPYDSVEKILRMNLLESKDVPEVTSIKYRFEEYMALTGEITIPANSAGDFSVSSYPGEQYDLPHIKSVSLVNKIRVVHALTGFSRISPVSNMSGSGFVSIKQYDTRWYPAYEVRGEGIFIEFAQEDIEKWIDNNPTISQRSQTIRNNYEKSFIKSDSPNKITPKFVMLHTLSHLLITQLSFECGYNVASLSERIYCSEKEDGKVMAGILIYTASGDSEGTLGGLVRQGRPDAFPQIFKKAIYGAKICSNDPICIMSHGQGRDSLNLAACHTCALLPETCCEEKNVFLDRGMIIGTFKEKEIGFWNDI